jgi:CDP-glucose 4,6-dehydratase
MRESIAWTADWYRAFDQGRDMRAFTLEQISNYRGRK